MFANINVSVFVSLIVDIDGDELHNRHLLCYTSDVVAMDRKLCYNIIIGGECRCC